METRASLVDNFNKSEIKKRSTMRIVAIERIWWHGNDNKKGGNQSNLLIKCEMRSMQHQIIHDVIAQSLRWLFVLPLARFFRFIWSWFMLNDPIYIILMILIPHLS